MAGELAQVLNLRERLGYLEDARCNAVRRQRPREGATCRMALRSKLESDIVERWDATGQLAYGNYSAVPPVPESGVSPQLPSRPHD